METQEAKSPRETGGETFHVSHWLAWMGGILCALVPFIGAWEIGAMQVPVRFGAGNLGFNLLIAISLCLVGGLVGGYWWRILRMGLAARPGGLWICSVGLFSLGLTGCLADWLHPLFFPLVGFWLLLGGALALLVRRSLDPAVARGAGWKEVAVKPRSWNVAFFILLLLVLVANNLTLVVALDLPMVAKWQLGVGRVLTQGMVVGICWLLLEWVMRATPLYWRWTPWLVFALFPLLVVADQLIASMWSRPLIHVVNAMTQSGSFRPEVELAASGLELSPWGAWCVLIGVWAVAMLLAAGCWVVSKRFKAQISAARGLTVIVICWFGVIVEQGVAAWWQDTADRQEAHKLFAFTPGLFTPPEGVGSFRVRFHRGEVAGHHPVVPLGNRPDVFIFMLESTRADAIRPDVAPFLSRFRDEECQPLGEAWSGSNATHLSWFSFFHSRVPVFWREALEGIPDRSRFAGAQPLQLLKRAGYVIEVRAVCDLSYKDFGLSNFGSGTNLASTVVQANDDNAAFSALGIAERERLCFEQLRASVLERADGGVYLTALDSPHYNYYWHEGFDPPFTEYDETTRFPLNPSENEVQRVVNRYWNAVAWCDSELEKFCAFLKQQGRYDNSIIIVTGDHGEEFQEQGSWFHCSSLQPEQTQVPLLIKWPAALGRGPEHRTASHMDVMPSLLAALGMPESSIEGLSGVNLLEKQSTPTAVVTTAYAGQSGETMALRRGDYEAVFSWKNYWEAEVPEEMVLERLSGPDGEIRLKNAEAYRAELMRVFPDAFERIFASFEVVE